MKNGAAVLEAVGKADVSAVGGHYFTLEAEARSFALRVGASVMRGSFCLNGQRYGFAVDPHQGQY